MKDLYEVEDLKYEEFFQWCKEKIKEFPPVVIYSKPKSVLTQGNDVITMHLEVLKERNQSK